MKKEMARFKTNKPTKTRRGNESSKPSIIVLVPAGKYAFLRALPVSWLGRLWFFENNTSSGHGY